MFQRIFTVVMMSFFINGCVGTMKITDAPSKKAKDAPMHCKSKNNTSKK